MSELPEIPNLDAAKAVLDKHSGQLRSYVKDQPSQRQIEAARIISDLIEHADNQTSGWGRVNLDAQRALGYYINHPPIVKGRPKKDGSSGLTYEQVGVRNRQLAERARATAAVPEEVYRNYREAEPHPSERGLYRFYEVRRNNASIDPVTQRVEAGVIDKAKEKRRNDTESVVKSDATDLAAQGGGKRKQRTKLPEDIKRPGDMLALALHPKTEDSVALAALAKLREIHPDICTDIRAILEDAKKVQERQSNPGSDSNKHGWQPLSYFHRRIWELEDLLDDYRRMVRQLRRGSPDGDLKRQVAALRAELKKQKEKSEKDWEQAQKYWKEIRDLKDDIALLNPKPKDGDIRVVGVWSRRLKQVKDETVWDSKTKIGAAHHPEAEVWRVEQWGDGWTQIGDDHTSMAAAYAAAATTLNPESVRAADTSLTPEQRAERMAATDPDLAKRF